MQVLTCTEAYNSLPPINEVWGKVMFLYLCVILYTEGAGSAQHPLPIGRPGGVKQTLSDAGLSLSWMQAPLGRPPCM